MKCALVLALSLSACAPAELRESAGEASSPADAVFREGKVWRLELEGMPHLPANGGSFELPEAVLYAQGPTGLTTHAGLEVEVGRAGASGKRPLKLRLPTEQRFGGMRTLRLDPMQDDPSMLRAFAAARLYAALDVPAPRVTHVTLTVDGRPWGVYALVEHVGDVFLQEHFDREDLEALTLDADGALLAVEQALEAPAAGLVAARVGPEVANVGPYALDAVLDRPAMVQYLAATSALAALDGGWQSASSLALVDLGDDRTAHLAPFPSTYTSILMDATADPTMGAGGGAGGPRLLTERMFAVPEIRAAIAQAIDRAADCLEHASCLKNAVSNQAEALKDALDETPAIAGPQDPEAFEDLLANRARFLRDFLDRERHLDPPDGDAHYLSLVRREPHGFRVRFRNLTAGLHARAVSLVVKGAAAPAPTELRFDRAANWWEGKVELPAARIEYAFEVTGADHETRQVPDPTNQRTHAGRSVVDVNEIGALTSIDSSDLEVNEPSALTFVGELLATAGDEGRRIYLLDPDNGDVVESVHIDGEGLEGLAYDPVLDLYLGAEEALGRITWYDLQGGWSYRLEVQGARDGNGGLEGLALRASDGHVFAAKEKEPAFIREFAPDGTAVSSHPFTVAGDVSSLDWSESDGTLYALSDEDRTIFRLGPDMEVMQSWAIDVEKPEGIAVRDGHVWVVSDAAGTLDLFELDAWRYAQ